MPTFDGVTGPVYYRIWGHQNPRAAVLLLHGYGENIAHYQRLAAQLTEAGLEVWGLDHIGHGHTPAQHPGVFGSVDNLAENARILLRRLEETRPGLPVVLVGHSLGGVAAVQVATTEPALSGLVATGAPLSGLPREGVGEDPVMSRDQGYLDAIANDPLGFDAASAEDALWQAIGQVVPNLRARVRTLRIPVLLINGEHDCFTPPTVARDWADLFPDAQLVLLDGYHDIVNDLPHRRVGDLITDFVMRVSAPTQPNPPTAAAAPSSSAASRTHH
ncbi:alpha/beta hydrolase [Intrasporangium mesophilum]